MVWAYDRHINGIELRIQKWAFIITVNWILTKVPKQQQEKNIFQQKLLGQLDIHMQKNKALPHTTYKT